MPELPEVETIVRELNQKIKGKTIKSVEVKVAKFINLPIRKFSQRLIGAKIKEVKRRAKLIIIDLVGPDFLLIHLKLTGQLIYEPVGGRIVAGGHPIKIGPLPGPFTHIIFYFTDGGKLYFNDIRKFGYIKLIGGKEMAEMGREYGPEPLTNDFTLDKFKEIITRYPQRKIKQILIDQSLIAGIGNIYADESCFYAKVLPTRIVKTLRGQEVRKLYEGIKKILVAAIKKGGTSADTYVRTDGGDGGFVPYLRVYGREGEKCFRCQGKIKKIKLNGRGTSFCPQCQK
jgi:formamidopyrimidine-DNA glycosylase